MRQTRLADAQAKAHDFVEKHQLHYSLLQLRLVGILLLLVLGTRAIGVLFSLNGPGIQQISAVSALSNWLPLLPLGISLYLLGGGRQRQPREFVPTEVLHRFLVPLALLCLLVLPAITLNDVLRLRGEINAAELSERRLLRQHTNWIQQADRAPSPEAVGAVARSHGLTLPVAQGEPVALTRWRLARTLEMKQASFRRSTALLALSPYQRELLSLPRIGSTVAMQFITGIGLLLLHRQGSREIKRHGLTISLFFRADPEVQRRRLSY
jgi:hypothetical protein